VILGNDKADSLPVTGRYSKIKMKNKINTTKQSCEKTVAKMMGWSLREVRQFAKDCREFVVLYGENALFSKTKLNSPAK